MDSSLPNSSQSNQEKPKSPQPNGTGLLVVGAMCFVLGLALIPMSPIFATVAVIGGFMFGLGFSIRRNAKKQ